MHRIAGSLITIYDAIIDWPDNCPTKRKRAYLGWKTSKRIIESDSSRGEEKEGGGEPIPPFFASFFPII